ncbi:MAG: penicillin-binding protein 2 [Legionellales bacterium]|nr:penicillin-binding protein 2 [Legionellales bacterium]
MHLQNSFNKYRYLTIIFLFFIGISILLWRLVSLTIIDNVFLKSQGYARSVRVQSIPAFRGMITDRNGNRLAVSTPVYDIWINPEEFNKDHHRIIKLCEMLDLDKYELLKKLNLHSDKKFIYLSRGVNPHIAEEIKQLKINGCYLKQKFKRYYPEGEVTSHIVGFNNIDDEGQEGIELLYNDWLKGIPGKLKVKKNRLGDVIEDLGVIEEPKPGKDLQLSIDLRLQYIAHNALKEVIEEHNITSGSIVILSAKSGNVLAMANQPTYNPNKRADKNIGQFRNRAVTDLFEPGSVMKPFLVAAALDSGKFTAESVINTHPGWMIINGKTIKDLAYYGKITISEILEKSSNVGVIRMLKNLDPKRYPELLKKSGIGELTYVGFPGEQSGVVLGQDNFNHTLAVLSMGYSVSMTPLQLARAFSIFLGDGKLLSVSLLKDHIYSPGVSVITPKSSKKIKTLLEMVTKKGTARRGAVKGYRLASKTGTARILGEHGYIPNRCVGSIVGFGPASDPQIIVAVVLNDPKAGKYYGGLVAAPVFAKVISESFRILEIPKDDI